MFKKAVTSLLLLPFMAGMTYAQGTNTATTMICLTSDGTVRISENSISIADYRLAFDSVIKDGVLRFVDPASGAVAVLDARDDRGLYLEVLENGQRMQVVAASTAIRYEQNDRASEPASPSFSSVLELIGARDSKK
jgi:hypothetical protein